MELAFTCEQPLAMSRLNQIYTAGMWADASTRIRQTRSYHWLILMLRARWSTRYTKARVAVSFPRFPLPPGIIRARTKVTGIARRIVRLKWPMEPKARVASTVLLEATRWSWSGARERDRCEWRRTGLGRLGSGLCTAVDVFRPIWWWRWGYAIERFPWCVA